MKHSIPIVVLQVWSSTTRTNRLGTGFSICSLYDAVVPYTYYRLQYARKLLETNHEASKYYISGREKYKKYLVSSFSNYNSIDGSKISVDRYFILVIIAQWALEKKLTIICTMKLHRKGIPKEIKSLENREEMSVLHVFYSDKKILLALYIDKKKSGKRNVVVLSTLHDEVRVTKDQQRKPDIRNFYLGTPEVNRFVVTCTVENNGWCHACIEVLVGGNVYKETPEKLNTRSKTSRSISNVLYKTAYSTCLWKM